MTSTRISDRLRAPGLASLAAAALLLAAATPAGAQTPREKELEARVSELERVVKQLLQQQQGQAATAAAGASGAAAGTAAAAASAPAQGAAPAAVAATVNPPPIQPGSITPNAAAGTKFVYTGFVKADVLWTDASDGSIPENTAGRDFYVPRRRRRSAASTRTRTSTRTSSRRA
jgi:hypothetical protein